jgi:hypothetical protein
MLEVLTPITKQMLRPLLSFLVCRKRQPWRFSHWRLRLACRRVLAQERVHPCANLGMVPEEQVLAACQGQELGARDVLRSVLAKAEWVEMVILCVYDQRRRGDLLHAVARCWINRGAFIFHPINPRGDRLECIHHVGNERLLLSRCGIAQRRGDIKDRLQTGMCCVLQHPVGKITAKECLIDPNGRRELPKWAREASARSLSAAYTARPRPARVPWFALDSAGRIAAPVARRPKTRE